LPEGGEAVLETEDLYLAGLGLVRGGELVGVFVRGVNGRRMAVFRIEGKGMEEAERDYFKGAASVDLQALKFQVRRLKDRAFAALREEERHAGEPRRDRADPGSEPAGSRRR